MALPRSIPRARSDKCCRQAARWRIAPAPAPLLVIAVGDQRANRLKAQPIAAGDQIGLLSKA
eukprot:CAMPEP_0196727620 /NCGR_PEP_ID=MMETSP1091-20130531/8564_1 /TAXON_ID=302021 /ORGANISM="Rhodomonas sp., Strain CCMP768" /LENGTH=61 /DNA_ID=CAMNT_0042070257 /DNA_START=124 /DNA_END=309 /DNA_ORIENTATION=+